MITQKLKANAIAMLTMGDSPQKVSDDFELPYKLVLEWYNDLDETQLTKLKANTTALERVVTGVVMTNSQKNVDDLREKIELVALDIAKEASLVVSTGDIIRAKTLHLLADTCSKLYITVVNKGQTIAPNSPGSQALSMLEQLGQD